jgi:hypothetical protein
MTLREPECWFLTLQVTVAAGFWPDASAIISAMHKAIMVRMKIFF